MKSQTLVKQRLQEASLGTSMTAEKVPTGGTAHHEEIPLGGEGGDGGDTTCTVEIMCGEADCDAIVKAMAALKEAGAAIQSLKIGGEEYDLETGEPKAPEGSPEHEQAETPSHEKAEHEAGGEHEQP
jgi:hypothetical protein